MIREELGALLAQIKDNFKPEGASIELPPKKVNWVTCPSAQSDAEMVQEEAIGAKL